MKVNSILDDQKIRDAVRKQSPEVTVHVLEWPHLAVTLNGDAGKFDADATPAGLGTPGST